MMPSEHEGGELSARALAKVSGPSWSTLHQPFIRVSECLLSPSSETYGDLTTIYVKFTLTKGLGSPVYAVVWLKSANKLTIGLALPDEFDSSRFSSAPKGMVYRGLTKYFIVESDADVPSDLAAWSRAAYRHILKQSDQKR
jgi:hypothetical protein